MFGLRTFSTKIVRYPTNISFRIYSKCIPGTLTRQVDPYSNIKITSSYHLNVRPYDVYECPDGNLLRISLQPLDNQPKTELSAELEQFIKNFNASIKIDEQNIIIDTKDELNKQSTVHKLSNSIVCLIEVPVKANLKVCGHRDVSIENLYSDDILVTTSDGNINTKNIHSTNLSLSAEHGNIVCKGSTLAQKMDVRTYGDKVIDSNLKFNGFHLFSGFCSLFVIYLFQKIYLQNTLGDHLTAISENGLIHTDSCYSENSKFITQRGNLQLKNVHKRSELYVLDGGELNVSGFHGILNAKTKGGKLHFQLTEVYGDSCIDAIDPISLNINISEFVEQHTCISIDAKEIDIDKHLEYFKLNETKTKSGKQIVIGNRDLIEDNLSIRTNSNVSLGKMSWMDSVKLKFQSSKDTP